MKINQKPEAEVEVIDISKHKGELKRLDGPMSDEWNNNLANETIRALWYFKNSDAEVIKTQQRAVTQL